MTDDMLIANMRSRIERCRTLAAQTPDEKTAEILRQIADEGEADIDRVLRRPTVLANRWTVQ